MAPRNTRIGAILVLLIAGAIVATILIRAKHAREALMRADPETILGRPDLAKAALAIGRRGFVAHCAACHGKGAAGHGRGVPDLTDGDYLYGTGQVAEIEQIVLHGIRSGDPRGWNLASMPVYSRARPYAAEPIPSLPPQDIRAVAQYLIGRHGGTVDPALARGDHIFHTNGGCWDCHGSDGGGDAAVGAPNLLDDIWLYGDGSQAAIIWSITHGRAGIMPAFARKLAPAEARAIAVYTASLSHPGKDRPDG